jgi:hypothetical protein
MPPPPPPHTHTHTHPTRMLLRRSVIQCAVYSETNYVANAVECNDTDPLQFFRWVPSANSTHQVVFNNTECLDVNGAAGPLIGFYKCGGISTSNQQFK